MYSSHCFIFISCHVYPTLQAINLHKTRSFDTLQTHNSKVCKTLTFYIPTNLKGSKLTIPSKTLPIFLTNSFSGQKNFPTSCQSHPCHVIHFYTVQLLARQKIVLFLFHLSKQSALSQMREQNNCFEKLCF